MIIFLLAVTILDLEENQFWKEFEWMFVPHILVFAILEIFHFLCLPFSESLLCMCRHRLPVFFPRRRRHTTKFLRIAAELHCKRLQCLVKQDVNPPLHWDGEKRPFDTFFILNKILFRNQFVSYSLDCVSV